jgi:hypothetical protein
VQSNEQAWEKVIDEDTSKAPPFGFLKTNFDVAI